MKTVLYCSPGKNHGSYDILSSFCNIWQCFMDDDV